MKTVIPFRLSQTVNSMTLSDMATSFSHRDPQSQQQVSTGFTALDHLDHRVFKLAIKSTKRVVPAAAVKRLVAEKAQAWLDQTGNPAGRKTMREFKDQAITELLPRAFLADSLHTVYLVDDLALFSSKLAFEFFRVALCRTTEDPVTGDHVDLASPLIAYPDTMVTFPGILTEWATDEPPEPFSLGDKVKAKGPNSALNFQSPSILSEFPKVASSERRVSELEILSDNVSFRLTEQFTLKSVKLSPEYRAGDLLTARQLARTVNQLIEVL